MHRTRGRSALVATVLSTAGVTGLAATLPATAATPGHTRAATDQVRHIATTRWGPGALKHGTFVHTRAHGGIRIGSGAVRVFYVDPYGVSGRLAYDRGSWRSRWVRPGFGLTRLVASYDARTPVGTFVEVFARARTTSGALSSWDSLGRWASHDRRFHRMSLPAQRDDYSHVAVDTVVTDRRVTYRAWQLRVDLYRRAGSGKTPVVTMLAAVGSRLPGPLPPTSRPGVGAGHSLRVPRYSQMTHQGEYPRYNGGGEAWCSPTSTSMVLSYWHRGPTPRQYAWVNPSYPQPWVDYAARYTFAWGYDGTGDWPFNTAYAARFGLDTFVTRLRSLREAELFVRAGVPLVASISFGPGQLDGAPIGSSQGHLLVIRGFTPIGNVIVNDPAAQTAATVRRVYMRGQFERAWLAGSGGTVYVIHPRSVPLPAPARHRNW